MDIHHLKVDTQTVHIVEDAELEAFLTKIFNRRIEIESPHGGGYTRYDVRPLNSDDYWESNHAIPAYEKLKTGTTDKYVSYDELKDILNGLCADNVLASGIYFVNYDW